MYTVFRIIRFHVTISQTNGEVRIRIPGLVGLHAHQTGYVKTMSVRIFLQVGYGLLAQLLHLVQNRRSQHYRRIVLDLLGRSGRCLGLVREDRIVVQVIHISVDVAAELRVDHLRENGRQILHVLLDHRKHLPGYLAVRRQVVILVEVGVILLRLRFRFVAYLLGRQHPVSHQSRGHDFDRTDHRLALTYWSGPV